MPCTDCYGRLGLQVSSGSHVAALLGRTTDGLYKSMLAFDSTLARIKSGGFVPWTAPAGEMTILHTQWVASLTWQWATVLTDTAALSSLGDDIDDAAYTIIVQYCADAADQSVRSMQMVNSFVRDAKRPGNTTLLSPILYINPGLLELMWALVDTTYRRVAADMSLIQRLGVPVRFTAAFKTLEDTLRSLTEVFGFQQDQWRVSGDITSRRQILQDTMRLLPEFYKVGQQIWAPYLMNRVFIDAVRSSSLFEKYQLGIDPWVLTDPAVATSRILDQKSCISLAEFWLTINDRLSVVALQNLINDAIMLGQVERLPGRNYQIPPWHGQYQALEPLEIGDFQCDKDTIFTINFRGAQGQRVAELRVIG